MKEKTSINLRKSMNRGSVEQETKIHDKPGK